MNATEWLTLALVAITAFYAWVTHRIQKANETAVEAMQQQIEAQLRPYVVVALTVRAGTTLLCLEIQNTGKSPALGLRLKMDRDFYPHAEKREHENIAQLPAFSQVIESLAPGSRLVFLLGLGATVLSKDVDESLCPKVFHIQADYNNFDKKYSEDNIVDLRPMLHTAVTQDPIADELEKLRRSLEALLKR